MQRRRQRTELVLSMSINGKGRKKGPSRGRMGGPEANSGSNNPQHRLGAASGEQPSGLRCRLVALGVDVDCLTRELGFDRGERPSAQIDRFELSRSHRNRGLDTTYTEQPFAGGEGPQLALFAPVRGRAGQET